MNERPPAAVILTGFALAAAVVFAPVPAPAAGIAGLERVATHLRTSVSVPVYLPVTIPDSVLGGGGVRAGVASASGSAYDVAFFQGRCSRPACRFGFVRAARAPAAVPAGRLVPFPGGGTAYFVPATCTRGCDAATLTWTRDGERYVLGLRGAGENALRFMAGSIRRF